MNKTNTVFKKALLVNAIFLATGFANAQWAVTDNTTHQLMGQVYNQLGKLAANQSVQISQQDQLNYSADQRNRIAIGQADIARRDFEQMPTLRQCVERTEQRAKATAIGGGGNASSRNRAAASGGGGGGRGELNRAALITSNQTALAPIIATRPAIGTCTTYDVAAGVGRCASVGNLSGADRQITGITRNIEGGAMDTGGNRQQVNMSLSDKGHLAGIKHINDATLSNAPGLPPAVNTKQNPIFMALYDSLMIRLFAAHGVMTDVLNMFVGSPTAPQGWGQNASKWATLFPGETFPTNPSRMDVYRFESTKYFLKEDDLFKENDAASIAKRGNNLLALNNMLVFEQIRLQQNNNILLSHILVQLTTPVDESVIQRELARTRTMTPGAN